MANGAVPIRESVAAAFAFVRENTRFVAIVALVGSSASVAITALGLFAPAASLATMVASGVAQAFVYAALIGCALFGATEGARRWRDDGWRLWAAMAIIGFFLMIVVFVISIPVAITLIAGPMAPYLDRLQHAGSDQDAVMSVVMQFTQENPLALSLVMLFYTAIWILLTSRLYVAAPATVDAKRILTFETWSWTKGAMMRITAARLLLLAPAYMFVGAVGHLIGRMFGVNTLDATSIAAVAAANPAAILAFDFIRSLLILALYLPLEAGLSTYLYRGLKPVEPQKPA